MLIEWFSCFAGIDNLENKKRHVRHEIHPTLTSDYDTMSCHRQMKFSVPESKCVGHLHIKIRSN